MSYWRQIGPSCVCLDGRSLTQTGQAIYKPRLLTAVPYGSEYGSDTSGKSLRPRHISKVAQRAVPRLGPHVDVVIAAFSLSEDGRHSRQRIVALGQRPDRIPSKVGPPKNSWNARICSACPHIRPEAEAFDPENRPTQAMRRKSIASAHVGHMYLQYRRKLALD